MILEENIDKLNKILMKESPPISDPGLLDGKMGISIYFFHLAKETGHPEHQNFAEQLLDEVYEEIQKKPVACSFANGLAGIAWGINHLINESFVEADVDEVLSDVDNKIFYHWAHSEEPNTGFMDGLLGYLNYVVSRVSTVDKENIEKDFVFKRLLIDALNLLSRAIDGKMLRVSEPPFLNFNWDLPICLTLLGKISGLRLYCNKVNRMIESLSPQVLSYLPYQQGNKLYLLYGIQQILKYNELPQWEKHAQLIGEEINLNFLLTKELKDKSIFYHNGLAGASFLLKSLPFPLIDKSSLLLVEKEICERIIHSDYFVTITKKNPETKLSLGLMHGLAGLGLHFLEYIKIKNSINGTVALQPKN